MSQLKVITDKHGNLIIRNSFYNIKLNRVKGGSLSSYYVKNGKAGIKTQLYREGCEIWNPDWGPFTPNHFQQEYGGSASFVVKRDRSNVKVGVSTRMGRTAGRHNKYTSCEKSWLFRGDSPLISFTFSIEAGEKPIKEGITRYKNYFCFRPSLFYTHYAYSTNGKVVSGPMKEIFRGKPVTVGYTGTTINLLPPPRWVTIFNRRQGFAMIYLESEDDEVVEMPPEWNYLFNPIHGGKLSRICRSPTNAEILFQIYSSEEYAGAKLMYLAYLTTKRKKWTPIERYLKKIR
ncbi:hypothetical protein ES702_07749 [subsurface metagenome]